MKFKIIFSAVIIMATFSAMCQTPYSVIADSDHPGAKILKGMISKEILKSDPVYSKWYAENQKIYLHPDSTFVSAFKKGKDSVSYVIFGGTWCDDTQFILPKFFMLQEQAGVPDSKITFYGVDRSKQTSGNIAAAFNIINVPTIIVMKNGQEKGRIVEYGKTGKWDKELADLLNK